jgi:hypothetical protein
MMPVSTRKHLEALREADQRALEIKQVADEKALSLAREIQTYKDEKANELRSQIERERGEMATKGDLTVAIEKVEALRTSNYLNARTFAVALLAIVAGVLANAHVFG